MFFTRLTPRLAPPRIRLPGLRPRLTLTSTPINSSFALSLSTTSFKMSKPTVLICGPVLFIQDKIKALEDVWNIITVDSQSRSEFLQDVKTKYNNVDAIYRHGGAKIGNFDKEIVDSLPASVKFIAHHGAGYDDVDVAALTARGIKLAHTPGAVDHGTATVALFLILASLRQFYRAEKFAREGKFKSGTELAHDPEGKVLGIVGMGGIGRALAKRALPFDMKIQYHNRNPVDPSLLADLPEIKYVPTLKELLETSDIVSVHVPLNKNTEKLFGKAEFAAMKDGAVIVNTARGGVIDEEALLEALDSGKLFSAGLDVFPDEPNINPKLAANDRITLLPHMGTETIESRTCMETTVLENLKAALKTGKFINLVPEQKNLAP